MKNNIKNLKEWEKNYFGIISSQKQSPIYFYLKFLNSKKFEKINGDIVEAGVFKGSSLISSALILKSKKAFKNKKIWGYDTFTGFPKYSKKDDFEQFRKLYETKQISLGHFKDILKLKKYHKLLKKTNIKVDNISSSNKFDNTSVHLVKKKINFFSLSSKINLIKGDFKRTLKIEKNLPKKISAGLIDCDLFEGYEVTLKFFWPRLSINGRLFLDEYYSLKFPGPRIAVNSFLKKNKDAFLKKEGMTGDFERWSIIKMDKI